MRFAFAGIRIVFRDRKLWPYVVKPMLLGAAIYILILVIGFALVVPAAARLAESMGAQGESMAWLRSLSSGVGAILFAVLMWFLSGIVFLAITSIFSSFLWEKLSVEIEERIGVEAETVKVTTVTLVFDSVFRFGLACFVAVFSLLTGWLCLGILGILAAGWLGLYDYTCAAYLRRGQAIWNQAFEVYRLRGWFSFCLIAGVCTLFPFVNVMLLPGLVAGGTMLRAQKLPTMPTGV